MVTSRDRSPQLIEVDRVEKRKGSKALVPLDTTVCANCGAVLVLVQATQPALFYFAGYGEAKRGSVMACFGCGWTGGTREESTNPRRL